MPFLLGIGNFNTHDILYREILMIDVNELRKGVTFEMDGQLFKVIDYSHKKPGRGSATIRIKAKNLLTGANVEKTFNSSQTVQDVRLEYQNVQYLYSDGEFYIFMDNDTFEQSSIKKDILGDDALYLTENLEVKLTFYKGNAIDVDLPTSVDLEVKESEMAIRGDTATGVTKKVRVHTGLNVQVPNFINVGDTIRVDTRTGEYITRA